MRRTRKYLNKLVVASAMALVLSCENSDSIESHSSKPVYSGIARKESALVRNFEDIPSENTLNRYYDKMEYFLIEKKIYDLEKCEKVALVKMYKIEEVIVFDAKVILNDTVQDLVGFKVRNSIIFENFGTLLDLDLLFYDKSNMDTNAARIGIYGELIRNDNVFLTFLIYYHFEEEKLSLVLADEGIPFGSF